MYAHQLTLEEEPVSDENGTMLCRCAQCKSYYYPLAYLVWNRIKSINANNRSGDSKLYCSEKCKQECDVYNAQQLPKSQRGAKIKARCNQRINRQSLLQIQLDEFGYNYCEKCGKEFPASELIIHHNIMVSKDLSEADNMSHQMLVCKDHHEHKGC
jgi:hypothetical protein